MRPGGCTLSLLAGLAVGCGSSVEPATGNAESTHPAATEVMSSPTFNRDVAPILFDSCVICHREGQSAPFPLWTYEDARNKRRQIVRVTKQGWMPPWLPEPGHAALVGERRLTPSQRQTLERWAESDAPEGDPEDLPERPEFADGWQRGTPDLVVELDEAFEVPPDGPELFRNFILGVPTRRLRYVTAVEIRPGSPAAHHGILQIDLDRRSRSLVSEDGAKSFDGMSLGFSSAPDGHFLGWTPGKSPSVAPKGMPWRLYPASDLILQLHLTPTGKTERVRPKIGLYFTEEPPRRSPVSVVLYSEAIDIPAGARRYLLEDSLTLPVPVRVHGLYPHAHYLCREMEVLAELPTGERRTLLNIASWDFDWQDDYQLVEPMLLPAQTRLRIQYVYDNSTNNLANPSDPPVRVRFGQGSRDEMGTLSLTLVPEASDPAQRRTREVALDEAVWRRAVERTPGDWSAYRRLAAALADGGDVPAAVEALGEALRLRPDYPDALTDLASHLLSAGQVGEARDVLTRALELEPDHAAARHQQALVHLAEGDPVAAEAEARAALREAPNLLAARVLLGNLLARRGEPEQAIPHFERALALSPDRPEIHNNLATAHFQIGQLDTARHHYTRATTEDPEYFNAWFNLGRVLKALGETAESRRALERARSLNPDHPGPQAELDSLP